MNQRVEIEVSARHIHLSKEDFLFLFGADATFKEIGELSQENEYTTDKIVIIAGPDGELPARFLSPFRELTQVELSLTDCYQIGILAPYETDVADGAAEIIIKGDQGETKRNAAIVANRHLHANPAEARSLGIAADQQVKVVIETKRGKVFFDNVVVKIAGNFRLRVHLDTDEGNAAGILDHAFGKLIIDQE